MTGGRRRWLSEWSLWALPRPTMDGATGADMTVAQWKRKGANMRRRWTSTDDLVTIGEGSPTTLAAYHTSIPTGAVFMMAFANGDQLYFRPSERLKNGNWKGVKVMHYADERTPRKAVQTSVDKYDAGKFKEVDPVPAPVARKLG